MAELTVDELKQRLDIIAELKSRIDITWEEEITEKKLENIVKNSIPKINRLIGKTIEDYTTKGLEEELELLLNYCMYAWENKIEMFKNNYIDDIMSLRQKYQVENYIKSQEAENE